MNDLATGTLAHCQHILGWSNRQLAERLEMDERQIRRWRNGSSDVPAPVAAWIYRLAQFHQANPPPPRPVITAPS